MIAHVFSGGKDSTISAFLMLQAGFDIELVTFLPKKHHSYMLQTESLNLTPLQAEALGLKHHIFHVSGEKEKEVEEMRDHLSSLSVDGISSGAIESWYQRQRLEWIGEELNVPTYSPLWMRRHIVKDIAIEMDVRLSKVAAYGLDKTLIGASIKQLWRMKDKGAFIGDELLEGGEGETVVLDAPFFNKRIVVNKFKAVWHNDWGEWIVEDAALHDKVH